MFASFGWDVVVVKHGTAQRAAFAEPGGARLKDWLERCPNQLYSALTFQGGAAWRRRLLDEIGDQAETTKLIERRDDSKLAALMGNLGGHDIPSLLEAFRLAATHDRPTLFICYTIKGFGLPLARHKDNHAGLMTPGQMDSFRSALGVRPGHEWDKWEGARLDPAAVDAFVRNAPFFAQGRRRDATGLIQQGPGRLDTAKPVSDSSVLQEVIRDHAVIFEAWSCRQSSSMVRSYQIFRLS
jgi:pyruvate dehydrogenase E1 component